MQESLNELHTFLQITGDKVIFEKWKIIIMNQYLDRTKGNYTMISIAQESQTFATCHQVTKKP